MARGLIEVYKQLLKSEISSRNEADCPNSAAMYSNKEKIQRAEPTVREVANRTSTLAEAAWDLMQYFRYLTYSVNVGFQVPG